MQFTMASLIRNKLLTFLCDTWIPLAGMAMVLVGHASAQRSTCDGYVGYPYCYTLYKSEVTWEYAVEQCRLRGGTLASPYTSTEQGHMEDYLIQEGVTVKHVWTSGIQPNPEIFWGNPISMWRWIADCSGECAKTGCDGAPLDMAFLLDASGSITDLDWQIALGFINKLMEQFQIGPENTRASLVKFGNEAHLEFGLDEFFTKRALVTAINATKHLKENTNTAEALELTKNVVFQKSAGDRLDAPNVAIVVTDGRSTYNHNETIPQAKETRDSGVQLFVIGVTPNVSIEEVRGISSPPQRENLTYALVRDFRTLNNITKVIEFAQEICQWHYMVRVVNNSAIENQGCFDDQGTTLDLIYKVDKPGFMVTPTNCVIECYTLGYLFAGVKITRPSGANVPVCSCGNEFGGSGTAVDCNLPCNSPNADKLCGGLNKNFVYKTDGVHGDWARNKNQPDNQYGYQHCGAIDTEDTDYLFADEICSTEHRYICQLPLTACDNPPSDGIYRKYQTQFGSCLYSSSARQTWHKARRACQDKQGELMVVTTDQQHLAVKNFIDTPLERYYFVGLYKEGFFWVNREIREFKWMNFADVDPDYNQGRCVYLDPTASYEWRTDNCNNGKYYMCQRETTATTSTMTTAAPATTVTPAATSARTPRPTAAPTPAPTTPAPVTLAPATPAPPTAAPRTPAPPIPAPVEPTTAGLIGATAGQVISPQDFWTKYWWVILILGLLLLLLALILLIFFCCRKRKKVAYDARPIANAPISSDLGDNETYDYQVQTGSQVNLIVGTSKFKPAAPELYNAKIDAGKGYTADGKGFHFVGGGGPKK